MQLRTTDLVMWEPNNSSWEHVWFTKRLRHLTCVQGHLGTMLEIKVSIEQDQALFQNGLEYLLIVRTLGLGVTPAWVQGFSFRPSFSLFYAGQLTSRMGQQIAQSLKSPMEWGLCRIRHFRLLVDSHHEVSYDIIESWKNQWWKGQKEFKLYLFILIDLKVSP